VLYCSALKEVRMRAPLLGIALTVLASNADAGPINLSFEEGLTGWTVSNPTVLSIHRPEGSTADPVGYYDPNPDNPESVLAPLFSVDGGQIATVQPTAFSAIDGTSVALVGTSHDAARFMNPDPYATFDIVLSQTFDLTAGAVMSGSSLFYNGDAGAQDSAWVRIADASGAIVAQPWFQSSGVLGVTPFVTTHYQTYSDWLDWSWIVPTTGTYTLMLGATSLGDDELASIGYHDAIHVPEPATLGLLAIACAIAWSMQRRQHPVVS
jgi:hypothetical protein